MSDPIKTIEDLSLNAWPSYQMQYYDGWILRYSSFYTHRTNCVEQIGTSTISLSDKVRYCEEIYSKWETPAIFKISPVTDPRTDAFLDSRKYRIEHTTMVMTLDEIPSLKKKKALPIGITMTVRNKVDDDWIFALFRLKDDFEPERLRIVTHMYSAIPKDEIAITISCGGRPIGTALGILDRDYIGIYAVHVDTSYRRMGLASIMIETLLREALKRGVGRSYLQVVSGNDSAHSLYEKYGFKDLYSYWFRVQ